MNRRQLLVAAASIPALAVLPATPVLAEPEFDVEGALANTVDLLEAMFQHVETCDERTYRGQPHTTFINDLVKREADPVPYETAANTPEEAISRFSGAFIRWQAGQRGDTLVWRVKPRVSEARDLCRPGPEASEAEWRRWLRRYELAPKVYFCRARCQISGSEPEINGAIVSTHDLTIDSLERALCIWRTSATGRPYQAPSLLIVHPRWQFAAARLLKGDKPIDRHHLRWKVWDFMPDHWSYMLTSAR